MATKDGTAMSTPVTTSLNAWRRVSLTERVIVKDRGRVCAHESCDTILSMYNHTSFCSAHVEEARVRRRRALQVARTVACEHCGAMFETKNTHRKYCSDRCRMAAFARRKRAAERARPAQERVPESAEILSDAA
jgi:endogenous inhibitor of DNA gyrase (YacG/DUF329 family)